MTFLIIRLLGRILELESELIKYKQYVLELDRELQGAKHDRSNV